MSRRRRELYVPEGVAPYIALERQGDCLVVTFNRPEKHNAFPDEAHDDLPLFFASLGLRPIAGDRVHRRRPVVLCRW